MAEVNDDQVRELLINTASRETLQSVVRSETARRSDANKLLDEAVGLLSVIQPVLRQCVESKIMPMASGAYQPAKDIEVFLAKCRELGCRC